MKPNHPRRELLRNIVLAFLIALLHLVMPAQEPTGAEQPLLLAADQWSDVDVVAVDRLMRAVKGVNLRRGPGTHYDKVGLLQVGEVVWVTGEAAADWLRIVTRSGRIAFVYAPLLTDVARRPATADDRGAVRSVAQAHRAVWNIHNVKAGETFGKRKDHARSTAFAIGPSNFITTVHGLLDLLERGNSLAATTLSQDGNPLELEVKQVLAVNVAHDLALIETVQRVDDYLRFIDEGAPGPGEQLWVMGYLDGFTRQGVTNGIVYEDIFTFAVATDFPDLAGMSGSPVLDAGGRVAGVGYFAEGNMLYGVKINYVKAFIAGESGTVCSQHASLQSCLLAGARQVGEMAAGGDLQAIYELGDWPSNVHRIDSSMGIDLDSLIEAARQDYAHAEFDLGMLHAKDQDLETAFALFKRAAEKDHPSSVFQLGRYYFNGWGTKRDTALAAYWLRKSSDQGLLSAKEYLKEKGFR